MINNRLFTFLILLLLVELISCDYVPNGYTKYMTFDEYSLKGVPFNKTGHKKPYILVKESKNRINVIMYGERHKNEFEYVYETDFWYCLNIQQKKLSNGCNCDTTPHFSEKFIFRDTIIEYRYYKSENYRSSQILLLSTRTSVLRLDLIDYDIQLPENKLLMLTKLKELLHQSSVTNPRLNSFTKTWKGDTLFVFAPKSQGVFKKGIIDVILFNRLGLMDFEDAKYIFQELYPEKGAGTNPLL